MARRQRLPKDHGDTVKKEREESVVLAEINPKRKIMADAILEGATPSEAARLADMHPASASTVLKSEDIKGYLAKAREEIEEISTMKRCDVLNLLIEAIDMARTLADPAQMINGAKEVGKMMGYYEPEKLKIEMTSDQSVLAQKLKQLTDQELLEIASGKARVIEGDVIND